MAGVSEEAAQLQPWKLFSVVSSHSGFPPPEDQCLQTHVFPPLHTCHSLFLHFL
jgi:hypothetical protein